ncbi:MAG TPA: hypothetical protein VHS81_10030 [Caulobacteraceae bacterium]|nr:hypothetical protein [Caulobacteraceae bacterium]
MLAAVAALAACSTAFRGGSGAAANTAPNVDVYFMLDTSPSMEIASTESGREALEAATQLNEGGCAFGCHQSDPSDLSAGSGCFPLHTDPATNGETGACRFLRHNASNNSWEQIRCATSGAYADGAAFTVTSAFPESGRDNYDLSRCLGVTLRIDTLKTAMEDQISAAARLEAASGSRFRVALYETDSNQPNPADDLTPFALQPLTSSLQTAQRAAAKLTALEMLRNNILVSGDRNADMNTFLDAAIANMDGLMPAPGSGAHDPGEAPQEVLFIVTDGLNDQTPLRTYAPMDWSGVNCAAIKQRGIRIAVLYTTYVPGKDPWYVSRVAPALPTGLPPRLPRATPVGHDPMALAARQCASPGLYDEVSPEGDTSVAMQDLFRRAVRTARTTR